MRVSDDIWLEITRPGGGDPLPTGAVGEIVVTALRGDFPLLRLATGDLSALLDGARIRGWMGRADQTTKVKGMFVHPSEIVEIGKRHSELGALRLIVRREGEQDAMILRAETKSPSDALAEAVARTMQEVTKLRGAVEFVAEGALPNDGKTIADERPAP
jgi:phenylacetate-CoA ligase